MVILFLGRCSGTNIRSGPDYYASVLFNGLKDLQNVTFIEYFFDGSQYSVVKKLFGKEFPSKDKNFLRLGLFPLLYYLLTAGIDIVHILSFERFSAIAIFLKQFLRYKVIYTCHGIVAREDKLKQDLTHFYRWKNCITEKLLINRSDLILCFSDVILRHFESLYHRKIKNYRIINPGIESRHTITASLLSDKTKDIIMLGGFSLREASAARIIERSLENGLPYEFTLIGFDERSGELKKLSDKISIQPKLPHDKWMECLNKYSFFIQPYSDETFSFAALEAMSLGIIVFAERNSGICRIIQDENNGFTFDGNDPEELFLKLRRMTQNAPKFAEISANAALTARELTIEKMIETHISIYEGTV